VRQQDSECPAGRSLSQNFNSRESWRDKRGVVIWPRFWKQWNKFTANIKNQVAQKQRLQHEQQLMSQQACCATNQQVGDASVETQPRKNDLSTSEHPESSAPKRQKMAKSNVGNFQRISLKSCEKMLHSSYDLPTKYEQPIRTSANTIAFSVRTPQAISAAKVPFSKVRPRANIASIDKPSRLRAEDTYLFPVYDAPTDTMRTSTDISTDSQNYHKCANVAATHGVTNSGGNVSSTHHYPDQRHRLAAQAEQARRRSRASNARTTKRGKPVYTTTKIMQAEALKAAKVHMQKVAHPKHIAAMKEQGRSRIHPELWLDGTPPHLRKQRLRDKEVGRDPDVGLEIGSEAWCKHYIDTINTEGEEVPEWFKLIPPKMGPYVKAFKAMAKAVRSPAKLPVTATTVLAGWQPSSIPWTIPKHADLPIVRLMIMAMQSKSSGKAHQAIMSIVEAELDQVSHVQRCARSAAVHLQQAGIEIIPEDPQLPADFVPPNAKEREKLQVLCDLPFKNPMRVPISTKKGKVDRDPWWETQCETFYEAAAGTGSSGAVLVRANLKCVGFSELDPRKAAIAACNLMCLARHSPDFTKVTPTDIPDHDVLYGGLNCAPFSKIGLKLGLKDKRAHVFWQFLVVTAVKRPKICLIENVANLIASNKGSNFAAISEIARMIGYQVRHTIRNAKDFLRTDRSRCFIFLVRNDLEEEAGMPEPELPTTNRQTCAQWLADPDLVPHTWVNPDAKYTELRSPLQPITDEEASSPVVVGFLGDSMTVNSKVFINMVPALKCNGSGFGGNTHVIRQFSKAINNWVNRTLDLTEVRRLHEPTTFKMRKILYDTDSANAISDIGASCPCDLLWPQVCVLVKFCQPVSNWRPNGDTTFEDIGIYPEKLGRYRDCMFKGARDMECMIERGQTSLASNHRPSDKEWSPPSMKDKQGVFLNVLPKGPAASKDPKHTNVIYHLEDAWRHNDPSRIIPIQRYYPPRSKFVKEFIKDIASRGYADAAMPDMCDKGTDQGNDTTLNQVLLPANGKSGLQFNYQIVKPFEQDIAMGCAVSYGPHLCPPSYPNSVHKTVSCEKDGKEEDWVPGTDYKRRGNSDLGNKGISDKIKAMGILGPNETVNLQLDMPNVHYITVRTIANAIMLLALCGRSPTMSAMDLARYYKQWFTRSRFFGTHCRYWASAVGPAIIMSLSMLFGGKVCSNIAQRGSDLIAHFVQTMVDLIQPKDPKVRRWYDVQLWASKQKKAGNTKYKDFLPFRHGATILPYQDDFSVNALPGFEEHMHCLFLSFLWCSGILPQCKKIWKDGNFDLIKKILGVLFEMSKPGTVELSIPPDKVHKADTKIDDMIVSNKATLLEVQELHGLLNWFSLIIVKAGSHLAFLIMALRVAMRNGSTSVCPELIKQLKFWKEIIVKWNGRSISISPMWTTDQTCIPSTDASRSEHDGGAGGVFRHWYFAFKWPSDVKVDLDIYHLEALACVLWLTWICTHHPEDVAGKRFRMWCDNEAWVWTIAKGRSSWPAMEFLGNYCHTLMAKHSFILQLDFLSTHKNTAADTASRFAWNEFFAYMQTSANLSQHELVQVNLETEIDNFAELVWQTRQLRCLSLELLTKH
jgi:hypothetical protein